MQQTSTALTRAHSQHATPFTKRGFSLPVACIGLVAGVYCVQGTTADEVLPVVPIGEDAYLMWDKLPNLRFGVRAYMRSTHDRQGNNRHADSSHFYYQQSDEFNVALDEAGPGVLYFVRTNHHHGSPWHYEVDGKDIVVSESATEDPVGAKTRLKESHFIPPELFPHPLVLTWPTTKGADLMWRPIPFRDSLRLAYTRTFYGTGYYIFHRYAPDEQHFSRRVVSWERNRPDNRVCDLLEQAGHNIAPSGDGVHEWTGPIQVKPSGSTRLSHFRPGPNLLRAIEFTVPREQAEAFGRCRLKVTWDDRWHPSIDAPVALFFGATMLQDDEEREYVVKGLPLSVRYDKSSVHLSCYWPMPYFDCARLEIENRTKDNVAGIDVTVRSVPYVGPREHVGYFHATYHDVPSPAAGEDVVLLDTNETEGGGPWSGSFVGMSWIFSHDGVLETLEGDPRFFFDDSRTPQAHGTGTEEWGGGGDYWGGVNMTTPLAGHPNGKRRGEHTTPEELVNSAYRFLIADLFPFGRRAVIGLEHGGGNSSREHYSGVTYWYGAPFATLELTDELNVCDPSDAASHNYVSPSVAFPPQIEPACMRESRPGGSPVRRLSR